MSSERTNGYVWGLGGGSGLTGLLIGISEGNSNKILVGVVFLLITLGFCAWSGWHK